MLHCMKMQKGQLTFSIILSKNAGSLECLRIIYPIIVMNSAEKSVLKEPKLLSALVKPYLFTLKDFSLGSQSR